ncbi:T6SS immunity protein Tdi1 domain-containing protein [Listeria booriae]|uniref:T6SS immunity protein Tdi1 domain-containing protein n=1 Tax=Listeria booriae TaxID=1552123 RepID=UPI0035DE4B0F
MASDYFKEKYFDLAQYREAVEQLGEPAYDECFGYVPLLALGGAEKVENLQKVKLREHILLISALAGTIQ